jgi:hypothetical protein
MSLEQPKEEFFLALIKPLVKLLHDPVELNP